MEIENLNQSFEVKLSTCETIVEFSEFFKDNNITKCVYTWYRDNPTTGKREIINIGKTADNEAEHYGDYASRIKRKISAIPGWSQVFEENIRNCKTAKEYRELIAKLIPDLHKDEVTVKIDILNHLDDREIGNFEAEALREYKCTHGVLPTLNRVLPSMNYTTAATFSALFE